MKRALVALFFVWSAQLTWAQSTPPANPAPAPSAPHSDDVREDIRGTIVPPTREQRKNVDRAATKAKKKKKKDCTANPQAPECRPTTPPTQ